MRIAYRHKRFRNATLKTIEQANAICQEYAAQGFNLTLRQVYYQFVARGLLANKDTEYKRLGETISEARLHGLLDWNFIQDRTRYLRTTSTWDDPSQVIRASAYQFKRDLWTETEQAYRPQVWVEKDALVDVVARAADPLRVPYLSCRGYVSQSEMWAAGQRIGREARAGLKPIVIHLGDHDPSGLDMTRDIQERLSMFAETPVEVKRIALNMDQIEHYSPPPNPAKLTDSRGSKYVDEFGSESWELDALEPRVLVDLITETVNEYVDHDAWAAGVEHEREDRKQMQAISDRWDDLSERWADVADLLDDVR